jgi:hypothetical protein
MEGRHRGVVRHLQGVVLASKQQAGRGRRAPGRLHAGACLLEEETKGGFCRNPLNFESFLGTIK